MKNVYFVCLDFIMFLFLFLMLRIAMAYCEKYGLSVTVWLFAGLNMNKRMRVNRVINSFAEDVFETIFSIQ